LHITLRISPEVGWMRREAMYRAARAASVVAAERGRIRVVHASIQGTHLHLLVEADDKKALARGMQGFQISVARNVNSVLANEHGRRRGRVFTDRYHLVVIESPRQARHVLSYILGNWRRHREDRHGAARGWLIDRYSSACSFDGWQELAGQPPNWALPADYEPLLVVRPEAGYAPAGSSPARSACVTFPAAATANDADPRRCSQSSSRSPERRIGARATPPPRG
jgi:putative transposase